ncbi:glycosyltransferase family 2 protein [Aestuariibaculum suncheonense]|uniref:Glycosyltransferase family 2 protein n=1 Tax=Aestuariibaculum suncheonense TaxID=1028745 RepID=A0A8J6QYU2_9FLAO|nr:glycosyltransferase family 2 protein [Aestuariibaculum suncheonense]MBD0836994.1 glycosyltransferase family 2 protein [Aestuariibaculum suncheonense]
MKVSVILPVYNGAGTLKETLDSLVNQTYQDFELLACIDGTKDASKDILEQYRNRFKVLRILENTTNRGLGPTMNRLVTETQGEYLAIAEQDDYYYPERLALQVAVLDKQPKVGMVSGIAEFWDGERVTMQFPGLLVHGGQYPEGEAMFLLNYRKQLKVANSCMMFRKSVHIENGLYFTQHHPSIGVDWTYVLRFSLVSRVYGLHQVLVRLDRRQNRTSVTTKTEQMFKGSRELLRSFAYEYPELISKKDFNYAMRGQLSKEVNHLSGLRFVFVSLFYVFRYPFDTRFRQSLLKRIKIKLNKISV